MDVDFLAAEFQREALADLPLAELQALNQGISEDVFKVLTPAASSASRVSYGGTAPDQVRSQIKRWKDTLR